MSGVTFQFILSHLSCLFILSNKNTVGIKKPEQPENQTSSLDVGQDFKAEHLRAK